MLQGPRLQKANSRVLFSSVGTWHDSIQRFVNCFHLVAYHHLIVFVMHN